MKTLRMKDGNGNIVDSPIVKTKKPRKFIKYNDPSHGWVKVPYSLLVKLGIQGNISSYSYQRCDYVYLEEDSDFTKFYDAMSKLDIVIQLKTFYSNKSSKIRSYQDYKERSWHGMLAPEGIQPISNWKEV